MKLKNDKVLPCTCVLRGVKATPIRMLQQAVQDKLQLIDINLLCTRLAACHYYKMVPGGFVGSWVIDVACQTGLLSAAHPSVQKCLLYFKGKVDVEFEDQVRIRIICSHRHKCKHSH